MPGLYSITTRSTGTVLTAAIYNADHQNHVDNQTTQMTDDYSSNAAQMQSVASPGGVGTESLATSLAGELERLRYVLKTLHGGAQWYPGSLLSPLATAPEKLTSVAGTNTITAAAVAAYAYTTGQLVEITPANTITGAATVNVTPAGGSALGAKSIFWNGLACVGGELQANIPALLVYDGTQFHVIASGFNAAFLDTHPIVEGSADQTKKIRIEADGLTTATTRVITMPDRNLTLGQLQSPTIQVFTGSGTYTKPANLVAAIVKVQAPGGGGGGADSDGTGVAGGGGGGGGGYAEELLLAAAIGATETVTIGAVGAAGSATNGTTGGTGGTTSFGALLSAAGGVGGTGTGVAANTATGTTGGAGGVGSGGSFNTTGGTGTAGLGYISVAVGGNGGNSALGGGGRGGVTATTEAGANGADYGGGGGGAADKGQGAGAAGGTGGAGIIIVYEFY